MPGERLWTPMCLSPAAARSSASDTLSCVRADFVLLCVHAVLDSCAHPQGAYHRAHREREEAINCACEHVR